MKMQPYRFRAARTLLKALTAIVILLLLATASEATPSDTLLVPAQYATIQAAINAASGGDIISVASGIYTENITIDKSISLTAETYDANDPRNNTIILDGGGSTVIEIPSGVLPGPTITGFVIRNGADGISPRSPMLLEYNYFTGSDDQIDYEEGSGGICRYNFFENAGDDAIDLDHQVADLVIEHNIMRQSGNDGIEIRLQDDTIPEQAEIVIRANEISGSEQDGIQFIDYYQHTNRIFIIERNLILNNGLAGIGLMDDATSTEDFRAASITERIHVFNNTFAGNDHGISGGDNLFALNNIFQDHVLALKNVDGDSIASTNLFWNNTTDSQGSNVDSSTKLNADPLLDGNYRLQAASPAIDAGTALYERQGEVVLDIPSSSYIGSAPDLGWKESEFGEPAATPTATPSGTSTSTNTPTNTSTLTGTAIAPATSTQTSTITATATQTVIPSSTPPSSTPMATRTATPVSPPAGAESPAMYLPAIRG